MSGIRPTAQVISCPKQPQEERSVCVLEGTCVLLSYLKVFQETDLPGLCMTMLEVLNKERK